MHPDIVVLASYVGFHVVILAIALAPQVLTHLRGSRRRA